MTYSISATGVNYECSKCHVNSTHFATFCLHLQRFHKLPMIFKCKQCQKAAVQNKIDEAEFKGMAILVVEFQALGRQIYIQGISQQRVISNSALVRTQILIFANILGPTCSLVRHIYAYFISFYFFDVARPLWINQSRSHAP